MQLKTVIILALAAPLTSAWTFTYGNPRRVDDGRNNKGCTGISHARGVTFSWDRGWFESCCVRLYSDRSCRTQVGFSCKDWGRQSSQPLASYKVTDC